MSNKNKYVKTKYIGIRKNTKAGTYRAEKTIDKIRTSKCFKKLKDAINWMNVKEKKVKKMLVNFSNYRLRVLNA